MSDSSKQIAAFHETDDGLFLDLVGRPGSVSVNLSTGDVLLDEGDGLDRYHGAAIRGSALPRFVVVGESGVREAAVELCFGNQQHHLGVTRQVIAALDWVDHANAVIRLRNQPV